MNDFQNDEGWSFVHVTDMHIGSPRSYRFQPAWNENWQVARAQIRSLEPDFLVVGGDMTRDGATHVEELSASRMDLESMGLPVHVIPGNHEVGNKWSSDSPVAINSIYLGRYRSVYGDSEWSFVHGTGKNAVRVSGFNAFLLGSGLAEETALRRWLEAMGSCPEGGHHVVVMHPAVFADRIDEADFDRLKDRVPWYFALDRAERNYLIDCCKRAGVTHVISGHIHCRRVVDAEGIQFHVAPSTAFPQWGDRWPDGDASLGFLQFSVAGGEISHRFVPLQHRSQAPGYGPGGNPPLAGRDYTVAWEFPPITPAS